MYDMYLDEFYSMWLSNEGFESIDLGFVICCFYNLKLSCYLQLKYK